MVVIGLTGSIGMGKSTTARFFAEAGVPVYDADAAVHRLYAGEAAPLVGAVFPGVSTPAGVDRGELAKRVIGDPDALKRLEGIIHPLVRREEVRFLADAERSGASVAVLDIPLLFETGADKRVDAVVVVSAPAEVQQSRVLGRPGMTIEKLDAILGRQMPDAEKRRQADFVVDTSGSFDATRAQIRAILDAVTTMPKRRK